MGGADGGVGPGSRAFAKDQAWYRIGILRVCMPFLNSKVEVASSKLQSLYWHCGPFLMRDLEASVEGGKGTVSARTQAAQRQEV